jgi:hypothetical protein
MTTSRHLSDSFCLPQLLGASGNLLIAAGGVQHTLFVLDASNFQDGRKV